MTPQRLLLALLVVIVLLAFLPVWPFATGLGWYPFGGLLGTVIVILVILVIIEKV